MELQLLSFPLLFTFILLLLVIKRGGNKPKSQNPDAKLPPGPWKLPIIGNLHQLIGGLPHHTLRDLSRKHGPIMHLKLGHVDHIIISSPEVATEIMKTHDLNFASRPELIATNILLYGNKGMGFAPYSSYWRQMRKISVLELLSARRVKSFGPAMKEGILNLIRDVSDSNSSMVNLTEMFLMIGNTTITRTMFGIDCKHAHRFISATEAALALMSGFGLADLFPNLSFIDTLTGVSSKMGRIHQEIDEILEEIIKEHQIKKENEEEEDIVDVLFRIKEKGGLEFPLTIDNVKAAILELFIGGTETSSTTLGWTMAELMRHPEVMKKVQAEIREALGGKAKIEDCDMGELHYLSMVIKESLRLHLPGPLLLPRICRETCVVGGYKIPIGTRVLFNAWMIGRDPRYWEDADSFRPERFDSNPVDYIGGTFQLIPFGGGRRICPGMAFAMAGMETALAMLLFYFDWELPNGIKPEELDMTETFGITVGRKHDLCLIASPHVPVPAKL